MTTGTRRPAGCGGGGGGGASERAVADERAFDARRIGQRRQRDERT